MVVLSDSKYKIKNIIIDGSKGINVGDYILAKKFSYKYDKEVEITIMDSEKIGGYSFHFLESLKEYKKEGIVDCYFKYKNEFKNFVGFNNEEIEFDLSEIESKLKLEDSKVYLFRRLQKIDKKKN